MKFAFRQLVKSPGFTIIALLTLALGIGANTTAFTVLNRFLLRPLPYRDTGRLVQIWGTSAQAQTLGQSPADYFDEREQNTVFEHVAAYYVNYSTSLAEPGQPAQQSTALVVAADFLPVLGVTPVLGRGFTAEDEAQRQAVVLLSHAYWARHFGSDEKVLGRTLRLDGKPVTVIGVMPASLDDVMLFSANVELWHLDDVAVNRNYREKFWYNVAARLKPGVTLQQAQAEMAALGKRLAHDFSKTDGDRGLRVAPWPTDSIGETGRQITWLIMDLALVVLLIACVNLANLQIVRTTGRLREYAIRLALGASKYQLIRLLLTESLLLSLAGGALGLLIARWGNSYLAAYFNLDMPLDYRVLAFALAASAATGATFGTLPAWFASHANMNAALKQGGRGGTADRSRHRLRHALIVAEMAMALILLTGAGYFVRGLQRIANRELGWNPQNVMLGFFSLPHDRYGEEGDQRSLVFADKFRADLAALPGVEQAAISTGGPVFGPGNPGGFLIDGRPPPPKGQEPIAFTTRVSPDFFAAYGMRLVQGRDFTAADRPGAPEPAIINQAMARKFWPGENPLGRRIGGTDPTKPGWAEIVGVVNDTTAGGDLNPTETRYLVFRPWAQESVRFFTFTLHTAKDPRPLADAARRTLAKIEPDIAITYLATAEEIMQSNLSGLTVVRRMLLEIAALGLLLSAVGIYGVIANLASERTQEIGIRMALGAQPGDVLWLFLRNGVRLALLGTAFGLLASFGLMRILNRIVAFVPGNDPWVVIGVAALLIGVALLACWLPARRATKVNPITALRAE